MKKKVFIILMMLHHFKLFEINTYITQVNYKSCEIWYALHSPFIYRGALKKSNKGLIPIIAGNTFKVMVCVFEFNILPINLCL